MKAWDLHCDTLSELRYAEQAGKPKSFEKSDLQLDLEKLKKGGYGLQCMAAFINLARQAEGEDPVVAALEQIDIFHRIVEKYAADVAPVYTAADIEKNAAATGLSERVRILQADYRIALDRLCAEGLRFDIALLDAPYADGTAQDAAVRLFSTDLMQDDGLVVIEHARELPPAPVPGLMRIRKTKTYGDCCFTMMERDLEP